MRLNVVQLSLVGSGIAVAVGSSGAVPGDSYLVEYSGQLKRDSDQDSHISSVVQRGLADQGYPCHVKTLRSYDSDLLRGASLRVRCGDGTAGSSQPPLEKLAKIPNIKNAWRLGGGLKSRRQVGDRLEIPARGVEQHERSSTASEPEPVLRRADSALGDELRRATHEDTGVLRLHDEKITGAGARIGVIGAAIDVTAPALRETNIVSQTNLRTGANGVAGVCDSEGTGTLGVAGGKGDTLFGYVGVAPDAEFEALSADNCGIDDEVTDIVDYFTRLYGTGLDVLTMPNLYNLQYAEAPWPTINRRLFDNGTMVVLSAGGSGPGPFTLFTPVSEWGGISVGGYDNPVNPRVNWVGNWTAGGETGRLAYLPRDPSEVQQFDMPAQANLTVWWPGALEDLSAKGPKAGTGCRPLPAGATPPSDPASTILLQQRGECWHDPDNSTLDITTKYGIQYVMLTPSYHNVSGLFDPKDNSQPVADGVRAVVFIASTDAALLISLIAKHGHVQASLTGDPALSQQQLTFTPNDKTSLTPSPWNSWGPTLDGHIGPSVLGPARYSMIPNPARLGGFTVWDGGSLAYVIGVVGLVKSAHPDWSTREIRNAIVATAIPVNYQDGEEPNLTVVKDLLAPVQQQGGGRVDAYAAVHSVTVVNVTDLAFNDTLNRPASLSFTITNKGTTDLSYQLGHLPAASGHVISADNPYNFTTKEALPVYAELDISPATVSVRAGESAVISVSVRSNPALPDGEQRVSYFGGFVAIKPSGANDSQLTVPYLGFGGPLLNIPSIDPRGTKATAWSTVISDMVDVEPGRVYEATYNGSDTGDFPIKYSDNLYPGFVVKTILTSRFMSVSIVNSATGKAPVLNATYVTPDIDMSGGFFWAGSEYNRTFVEAGTYVWEILSLRVNGDPQNLSHYDVWRSAEWTLVYTPDSTGLPGSG